MDPAAPKPPSDTPQQPAAPSTGGGANGDESTINGDNPIGNLPSSHIVAQKESWEADNVQNASAAAQLANQMNSKQITQPTTQDSQGQFPSWLWVE